MNINTKAIINGNIASLAALLAKEGILKAHAHYYGGGDEGGNYEVQFLGEKEEEVEDPSESIQMQSVLRFYEKGDWHTKIETVEREVADALEDICESLIVESGNGNYGDGDGGHGELTVFATGAFEYEHSNYVTVSEPVTSWTGEDLTTEEPEAPAALPAS